MRGQRKACRPCGGHDQPIGRVLMKRGGKAIHFRDHARGDGEHFDRGGRGSDSKPILQVVVEPQSSQLHEQRHFPKTDVAKPGPAAAR